MTSNRKKKLAVRAEAAGGSHARAARLHTPGPGVVLTADVQRQLIDAFAAAGWPVESDGFPDGGTWTGWLGPVWSLLQRPGRGDTEADPDDPDHYDLTTVPELTFITPRIPLRTGEAMVVTLPATTSGARLVRAVSEELARARAAAVGCLVQDTECSLCGDPYPKAHLLPATGNDRLLLCPFCVFDGDILGADPLFLAYLIDELSSQDAAVPAGWAAVTALLACAAGPDLRERLESVETLAVPLPHWFDPGQVWVWLPPGNLPAALQPLSPGTSLAKLVDAVERDHPDLRERFRARLADILEDEEDDEEGAPDYLVEELLPAAICYAVTAATQAAERPRGHSPWHLLSDGFEEGNLADCFEEIGSILDTDPLGPAFTLSVGVPLIAELLDLHRPDFPQS
ncbi:hypothetical protein [Kitasatospora sp. NPDC088783]|uniref:hypothetical protein n=1 Tax=Kitasatospora sp. NPDC088783 TaxID=3364077 RepID=UPI003826322D